MPVENSVGLIPDSYSTPPQEGVEITDDHLSLKVDPAEFNRRAREQLSRANSLHDELRLTERRALNSRYWVGDQLNKADIPDDQEKNVENDLFRNLETWLSIVCAKRPEFNASAKLRNDITRSYADVVRTMVTSKWIEQQMQKKLTAGVRNHQVNFGVCFKRGFNTQTGRTWTEEVDMNMLRVSKDGTFLAEYITDQTVGDVIARFPGKTQELLTALGVRTRTVPEDLKSSPITYIEIWTDELVGWIYETVTLGMSKNPHFDRQGQDIPAPLDQEQMMALQQMGQQPPTQQVFFNFFDNPRMPYQFITFFNRGKHKKIDDTTLLEQGIGLQDWINKRKRQIGMNADSTNGHWVGSADYLNEEQFNRLAGGINEKIFLAKGKPADGFAKIVGEPLPDYIFSDLQDSRAALDNLMGIHDITRGETSNNKTLGQDQLQAGQDFGRHMPYTRDGIEEFAREWAEWEYHLQLVYGDGPMAVAIPETDDTGEQDNLIFDKAQVPLVKMRDSKLIPVPMLFAVQEGSTLPTNEAFEYQKAHYMVDRLSPLDFFKKMGERNPKQLWKNQLMAATDPWSFFKDDPDVQAMLQAKAQQPPQPEPPKTSISVRADASTFEGAQLLENQGMLPQGSAMVAAHRQIAEHAGGQQQVEGDRRHQAAMRSMDHEMGKEDRMADQLHQQQMDEQQGSRQKELAQLTTMAKQASSGQGPA